ncbi:hypothetical protein C8R43DRAFT_950586 [Mycena crocata]|nr:hypothetical protein C8R43DRAFT_950586 [Mycena crocata]
MDAEVTGPTSVFIGWAYVPVLTIVQLNELDNIKVCLSDFSSRQKRWSRLWLSRALIPLFSLTSVTAQEESSVHYGVLDDVSTFAPAGHSIYSAHYGVLEKYLDPTFHLRSTSSQRFLVSAGFLYIFGHFLLKRSVTSESSVSRPLSPDSTRALGKLLGTRPVSYQVHVGRGFLGKASRSVPWSWFLCQVRHCKPVLEVRISERVSLSEFIALRSRRGRCIALSPSLTTPSGVTAERHSFRPGDEVEL